MRSSYYAVASVPGRRIIAGHYFRDSSVMCSSFFSVTTSCSCQTLYEVEFWIEGSSHKLSTHGFDPITCIAWSSTTY